METWDLYFATIVGMQLHPGYARENVKSRSLRECAELATDMMEVRDAYRSGSSRRNDRPVRDFKAEFIEPADDAIADGVSGEDV